MATPRIPHISINRSGIGFLIVPLLLVASMIGQVKDEKSDPKKEETLVLSPYTVTSKSNGYNSRTTFSGSRVAEDLLNIPTNISILTKEYLQDVGASNLLNILPFAGAGITQRVVYRQDFTVRGFRQALLIDGLTSNEIGFTPLYDVERVEIIKGPTALVFSNYGNVSGTVNYVLKRPTATSMGDSSVTIGNYGFYSVQATQRGPLNNSGSVRYRVTGGAQMYDGWMGSGQPGANAYLNDTLVSASVDWSVNKQLELKLDAGYKHARRRSDTYGYIDPITQKIWSKSVAHYSTDTDWSYNISDNKRFRAEAVYTVSQDLSFRALYNTSLQLYQYENTWNDDGKPFPTASEFPNYTRVAGMAQIYYDQHPRIDDTIFDATWSHKILRVKGRLNAGFNYTQSSTDYQYYATPVADTIISAPVSQRPAKLPWAKRILGSKNDGSQSGGWTAYAQEALSLFNEKLLLTYGGRYVSSGTNNLGKSAFVPSTGIVYKINEGVSVYGAAAESFTPRSGKDIFGKDLVNTIGSSKEAGLKFNLLNEKLFGTITYFDITNDPVLRQVQGISPITGLLIFGNAQVGKETNKGYEAEFGYTGRIEKGDWSNYISYYAGDPKNKDGLQPSSAVKGKWTYFSKYQLTEGAWKGFMIGGGVSSYDGSPGTGFPWMPGYTMYSALMGYGRKSWQVTLNISNLTDIRDALIGSEGVGFAYLAAPREIRTSIHYKW